MPTPREVIGAELAHLSTHTQDQLRRHGDRIIQRLADADWLIVPRWYVQEQGREPLSEGDTAGD